MNLIVFDIDDTLTKSEFQHQLAYVNAMKAFGIVEINKNWSEYEHHTDSHILRVNFENNLEEPFNFYFVHEFESKMTELMLSLKAVKAIKGAKDFIDYLSNRADYAMAFATGSFLKPAFVKLTQAGIPYDKKLVVGANEHYSREGIVQEAINRAKKYYGVDKFENIISVGDGIWDFKTARNLGVHFMGIGMKNLAKFEAAGLSLHIEDWRGFDLVAAEGKLGI